MTALTAGRRIFTRAGTNISVTVDPAGHGYAGGLAALTAAGLCVSASAVNTLNVIGVFTLDAAANDVVDVSREITPFANSTAGDLITKADIGDDCYVVDDQTVAKTSNSGARPRAGKVFDVDAYGVWIDFS
jgi:hypothetical protein